MLAVSPLSIYLIHDHSYADRTNTLQLHLEPGASHGLLMTLRVLYLPLTDKHRLDAIGKATTTYISPTNEKLVQTSLREICSKYIEEAKRALDEIVENPIVEDVGGMVRKMWEEQLGVATLVRSGLDSPDDEIHGH